MCFRRFDLYDLRRQFEYLTLAGSTPNHGVQ
jgi:hypothetical protein